MDEHYLSMDIGKVDMTMFDMEQREQQRIAHLVATTDEKCRVLDARRLSAKQKVWPPDPNDIEEEHKEQEDSTEEHINSSLLVEELWMISGLYYRKPQSPSYSPDVSQSDTVSESIAKGWF